MMDVQFLKVSSPVPYIPVGGTWSWDEDANHFQWWERGSEFTRALATMNLILHARTPFEWCSNIDGTIFERKHTIWKAAAKHFACHIERVPLEERNIVAHSHGGQVVFLAAGAEGVRINNLITVGTPVRSDMEKIVTAAVGNFGYWHHICDSKKDLTAILGTLWDGRIRIKHTFDLADSTSDVKGIGHSRILNDPKYIQMWDTEGWASILAYGRKAFVTSNARAT